MSAEGRAGNGLARLVIAVLAIGASVGAYRWGRPSAKGDPVGVVRAVAVRYPMVRPDLPVERLGPACDRGDGQACIELGVAFERVRIGSDLPLPSCVEHALFARACDEGHWRGCELLLDGGDRCGEPDLAHAEAVLDRACGGAVFAACDALGRVRQRRRG